MGQYYKVVLSRSGVREDFAGGVFGGIDPWRFDSGAKLMEHSWIGNPLVKAVCAVLAERPARVVWAGDYSDPDPSGVHLYGVVPEDELVEIPVVAGEPAVLVNFEKKEWVDLGRALPDRGGWRIHPLPLLVVEGNGRGGGDYSGRGMDYVGSWARDLLGLVMVPPGVADGWRELIPRFIEG